MSDAEGLCKHKNILRNCYSCHLEFTYPQEKTELDTLHETISELKIRVSKLEEYKRLQDDINEKSKEYGQDFLNLYEFYHKLDDHRKRQIDENRAISKHFDELISKISNGEVRLCDLEERYQGLFHEVSYLFEKLDKRLIAKTKGLTFEEAIVHFKNGKSIRRSDWPRKDYEINLKNFSKEATCHDECDILITKDEMLATDWEIVE